MTDQFAKETIPANLEQEMRQSYLDYAMSVIVGRALPDVRDGLKPVHRRALFAMSQLNNDFNKPYKKSARIVGDVIGKYHPHGDTAVYDTIVRLAQDFSMRYPLVDGQGNFGSVDGDSPAAMRYTEIRLSKIAHEILADLDKETVDFYPNYDESEMQPSVMPTRIPTLLVNGSSGIAVGMATNIPPHNLTEVINGCVAMIDNEDITIDELMEHIPGPDFPTSGFINGSSGIRDAYRTGRGKIYMRARTHIETNEANGRQSIIVTELPYMVNKARLLEKIAELVKTKKIDGITELRDESDKSGMRMFIAVRRGEVAEVILNKLFQQTQLQTVFGINTVALLNNQPRLFNLRELLEEFIKHRREVVTRRTIYNLRKARARAHTLEGLAIALSNIDEMIELIKKSASPAVAKEQLLAQSWAPGVVADMISRAGDVSSKPQGLDPALGLHADAYFLSEKQAQAILDLRLHRLTGLEQDKIREEYAEVLEKIAEFINILENVGRLMEVIREELVAIREEYGDQRRTEILDQKLDLTLEDMIAEEDLVVTLSHEGYAKSQPLSDYRAQRRGGKGKSATKTKDEDFVERMFVANSHDTVLCFSDKGKVYWLKVYELPQAGRNARGKPIVNLLPLDSDEHITAILPVKEFTEGQHVFMATSDGTVKKTSLMDFSRPRSNGIIALDLVEGNSLVGVGVTNGAQEVMLFTTSGKAIRFDEHDVRRMGRTARGVRGIKLAADHLVNAMIICDAADADSAVLTLTENGYGKRTSLAEYNLQGRGGQGVISIQTSERNGNAIGAVLVEEHDEAMLITNGGTLVRTRVAEVSVIGRNTQGVKVIGVSTGEKLISVQKVAESEEEEDVAMLDGDVEALVDGVEPEASEPSDAAVDADSESDAEDTE
ncbi:DNA gyrase subunit A [Arenicella xantha]|uniref:DNA gyrase subunit A n=1 Tax=Arenicella xantha TaxID=644221 RepID=A0A395JPI5_9GAMM|nr:DNA gyrase subunit A [Arenicella xantha]RBP51484.1 DNA gyrase subunit A [Arenicella xantha]